MDIKGDINVARTGYFGRRANQGLVTHAPISVSLSLQPHTHWWNRVQTDGTGNKNVLLPDPTLPEMVNGWAVALQNDSLHDSIQVFKSDGTFLLAIPPQRAIEVVLVDSIALGGEWYVEGVIELHNEVSFRATDWDNNQIKIIAQGLPLAGQAGPHRLPIGSTYNVAIWQTLGSFVKQVSVGGVHIDTSTGIITLRKAAATTAFSGYAFIGARL